MVIDGKAIAQELVADLKPKIAALAGKKFFGAAVVGSDPASLNFLKQKEKTARELGIDFRLYTLPEDITTDDLRREIRRLASVKTCGGFIVQLPLPDRINRHYALNGIPKQKDPDCLSEAALGSFYTNRSSIAPPSVAAVEEILRRGERELRTQTAVVIGAGFLIGKPVGFWLQNRVAELAVLDRSVKHLQEKLGGADIVISGAGHPHLFGAMHLKRGALVIDFGFSRKNGGLFVGDFDPEGAHEKNIDYTPTPGGTGPILVVKLFQNFYTLNQAP
jgi:methylenetetrahydrofolate dehydrogenase (NADP+)/methenyltetrahydrofolate cyclohydrolase